MRDLRLMRGVMVTGLVEKSERLENVTLAVKFDGAQYKMDLMKLAVEEAMFVEESYATCQAVVKMPKPSTKRLAQLNALITLV